MSKVITYGTFDLFHIGHVRLLRRLYEISGEPVSVGLSTDEFNLSKGKRTVIPFRDRKEILLACKYVSNVFPEESWGQKREDIAREKATIFAMGEDWAGHFDDLSDIVEVIYLPRTSDVSTTDIRGMVSSLKNDKLLELSRAADNLNRIIRSL